MDRNWTEPQHEDPNYFILNGEGLDFAGSDGATVSLAKDVHHAAILQSLTVNGILVVTLRVNTGRRHYVETCLFKVKEHGHYVLERAYDGDPEECWALSRIQEVDDQ